jgi:signal transduction histidine kinase
MKQRARLYDGNVHIDTAPGQGTRLTITIPTTRL